MKTKIILLFILIHSSFFILNSFAQSWIWSEFGIGEGTWVPSVSTDNSGNCYLYGYYENYGILNFSGHILKNPEKSKFSHNMFIVKYNNSGNYLWENQSISYGTLEEVSQGGITIDNMKNVYVTALFSDTTELGTYKFIFNSINCNYYIVKYNKNGNIIWANSPALNANNDTNFISTNFISNDNYDNIYVTGIFASDTVKFNNILIFGTRKGSNSFIVKYDSSGNALWAQATDDNNSEGLSITADKNNNAYMVGDFNDDSIRFGAYKLTSIGSYYSGDPFIVKYSPNGTVLWAKQAVFHDYHYGGKSRSVITDLSGNIYVAGDFIGTLIFENDTLIGANNIGNQGNIFLVKYDSNGNVLWAKQGYDLDKNNWGIGTELTIDNKKHLYLSAGGGTGNCEIAFGTDTLRLNDTAKYDVASIIVEFDSNGNALCGSIIPGGADYTNAIASDTSGNYVYFGSTTLTEMIFGKDTVDPFAYPIEDKYLGANYFPFIARWLPCTDSNVYLGSPPLLLPTASEVKVYPNPASSVLQIVLSKSEKSNFTLYNEMGREVIKNYELEIRNSVIDVNNLSDGIYLYRLMNESGSVVGEGKIVIVR